MKKLFWRIVYWGYPHTRNFLIKIKLLKHYGRQPYRQGFLRPDKTLQDLKNYLFVRGYQENPMAWVDPGEIMNVRKIITPHYQYHLRMFPNNEIKGHFECTPERHPIAHLNELAMLPAKDYFVPLLKDWLKEPAVTKSEKTKRQISSAIKTGAPYKG